jgi:NADH dehydrogenase FAD-containing subunit
MLKTTAKDIGPAARFFLRKRLKEKQVRIVTQAKVKSISEGVVTVETNEGEQKIGPFDTIVMAAGASSVNDLEPQVKGLVPEIYVIGDAVKPGKLLAALEKATEVALKL